MAKDKKVEIVVSSTTEVVKQKRGRKPKKQLVDLSNANHDASSNIIVSIDESNDSANCFFIDNNDTDNDNNINDNDNNINDNDNDNGDENKVLDFDNNILTIDEPKSGPKKRGRKPKGGKIIQQVVSLNNNKEAKPNIILHLKCSLKDLYSNTMLGDNIESFNFSGKNENNFEIISTNDNIIKNNNNSKNYDNDTTVTKNDKEINYDDDNDDDTFYSKNKDNDIRDVWKKLKVLEHNLHINNISDKKSACFWCTYDFDNPPVYIPKYFIKNSYHVYGCFCSPECATAHLMQESIDSSSKFERYHLINHIYTKIYDYKKNIKPAPNPFYLLDKFYGNLSIQEFRSLLRNERLFLVVDKPLTRILPELHEDNDDFIINNKIIPANTLVIKKKLQKRQQNKTNILSEKFGLSQ